MSVQATLGDNSGTTKQISYKPIKVIGTGSFGTVVKALMADSNETVAIKKVLQDKRFKNRELELMLRLSNPYIVELRYYFHSTGSATARRDDVYLNLVLEFIPDTVAGVLHHYRRHKQSVPVIYIRLYIFQLFLALDYMHSMNVCHRDVKPQNLLVNPETGVLKLCDMGR